MPCRTLAWCWENCPCAETYGNIRSEGAKTTEVVHWKIKGSVPKLVLDWFKSPLPLYISDVLLLSLLKRSVQSFTVHFTFWKCQVGQGLSVWGGRSFGNLRVGWEELGPQLWLGHWPCPPPSLSPCLKLGGWCRLSALHGWCFLLFVASRIVITRAGRAKEEWKLGDRLVPIYPELALMRVIN